MQLLRRSGRRGVCCAADGLANGRPRNAFGSFRRSAIVGLHSWCSPVCGGALHEIRALTTVARLSASSILKLCVDPTATSFFRLHRRALSVAGARARDGGGQVPPPGGGSAAGQCKHDDHRGADGGGGACAVTRRALAPDLRHRWPHAKRMHDRAARTLTLQSIRRRCLHTAAVRSP